MPAKTMNGWRITGVLVVIVAALIGGLFAMGNSARTSLERADDSLGDRITEVKCTAEKHTDSIHRLDTEVGKVQTRIETVIELQKLQLQTLGVSDRAVQHTIKESERGDTLRQPTEKVGVNDSIP